MKLNLDISKIVPFKQPPVPMDTIEISLERPLESKNSPSQ